MDKLVDNTPAILVLGAGRDQVFLIKTAKEMGLFVYCVDIQKNPVGSIYADQFYNISSTDVQTLKKLIDELRSTKKPISGIITMGSDIPHIVAELCFYAGTPSISNEAALSAKNKLIMKKKFITGGVFTPKFDAVSNYSQLRTVVQSYGDRLIVIKPLDQAGSRGVSLTKANSESVTELYNKALCFSSEKLVLIEQFIPGPQISTEHIISNGKISTPGFADRNYDELTNFLPQIMENGGWVPSLYSDKIHLIEREIMKAVRALDLNNCIVKGDVVLHNGRPMIIEVAARLSRGDFSESLVPLGTGVNYVKSALELCLGRRVDFHNLTRTKNRTVANRYFFAKKGKLKEIKVAKDLNELSWLKKIEFWIQPGDLIHDIHSHGQRSGVFVVVGTERHDVIEKIRYVYDRVEFIYETQ